MCSSLIRGSKTGTKCLLLSSTQRPAQLATKQCPLKPATTAIMNSFVPKAVDALLLFVMPAPSQPCTSAKPSTELCQVKLTTQTASEAACGQAKEKAVAGRGAQAVTQHVTARHKGELQPGHLHEVTQLLNPKTALAVFGLVVTACLHPGNSHALECMCHNSK